MNSSSKSFYGWTGTLWRYTKANTVALREFTTAMQRRRRDRKEIDGLLALKREEMADIGLSRELLLAAKQYPLNINAMEEVKRQRREQFNKQTGKRRETPCNQQVLNT